MESWNVGWHDDRRDDDWRDDDWRHHDWIVDPRQLERFALRHNDHWRFDNDDDGHTVDARLVGRFTFHSNHIADPRHFVRLAVRTQRTAR